MASVKEKTTKRSPSKTDTTGENTSTPTVINTFANDGSFLELFKKRMEAESLKLESKSESTVGQSTSCEKKDEKTVDKESCTKRDNDGKAPGPSLPLIQQVWFSEERMIELLLLWGNIPMWNVSFCAAERERYIILNISRTLRVTSI